MSTAGRTVVVKVGSSSITDDEGKVDRALVATLCNEVAALRDALRSAQCGAHGLDAARARLAAARPQPHASQLERCSRAGHLRAP